MSRVVKCRSRIVRYKLVFSWSNLENGIAGSNAHIELYIWLAAWRCPLLGNCNFPNYFFPWKLRVDWFNNKADFNRILLKQPAFILIFDDFCEHIICMLPQQPSFLSTQLHCQPIQTAIADRVFETRHVIRVKGVFNSIHQIIPLYYQVRYSSVSLLQWRHCVVVSPNPIICSCINVGIEIRSLWIECDLRTILRLRWSSAALLSVDTHFRSINQYFRSVII